LLDRKLITTAGRKAVIGRPILYKTTKEFLLRFGLKDVGELPSMEEFEKLVAESFQSDLPLAETAEVSSASAAEAESAAETESDEICESTAEASLESASAEEPPEAVEHAGEATIDVSKIAS